MTITQSLELKKPAKAITMWDFSWLERRWPGAGYEDWDQALDGLVERGYEAVRIDAYPHLLAADPEKEWELIPCWNQQDWGSPAKCRVRVLPALIEFIGKCAERGTLPFTQSGTRVQIGNVPATDETGLWPVLKIECDTPPVVYQTGGLRIAKVPHPHYDPCPSDIAHLNFNNLP
jgi:hypothetical protein